MVDEEWIYLGNAKTTTSKDREPVVVTTPAGNLFWADNQSGQSMDIKFSVNGKKTDSLPEEFTKKSVLLSNSINNTCNSLELYINNQAYTLVDNIPTEYINQPGDLRAATILCTKPEKTISNGYFTGNADIEMEYLNFFLASPSLDLIPNSPQDTYKLDTLDDEQINALMETFKNNSLLSNSFASVMNDGIKYAKLMDHYDSVYGRGSARSFLNEVMMGGRFSVQKMSQWNGKLGIVFKGNKNSRTFLTAINYGVNNDKISVVSGYAEIVSKVRSGDLIKASKQVLSDAIPLRGANAIGLVFSSSFDVYDFVSKDLTEQNFAELAGALGVTFFKVFTATVVGISLSSYIAFIMGTYQFAIPIFVIIGIGIVATVGFGVFLDYMDNKYRLKEDIKMFLKEAFPNATNMNLLEAIYYRDFFNNLINIQIEKNDMDLQQMIGVNQMNGSDMYDF